MGRERSFGRLTALTLALAATLALALGAAAQAAPPTVDFQASPATARINQSVGFTASASGADGATIASLSWDFGDSATGSGATVAHAYAATGTFSVTLTATDSNGETASAQHSVRVVGLPAAAFSWAPNVPNIDGAVAFDGRASSDPGGGIASYAWSFGDGANGTGATPSHSYATSGDKSVTLTITASLDGRTASVSHTVHVNVPPTAAFVFAAVNAPQGQDPFTPVLDQQVAFSAQGSGDADGSITSWAWDLGTGTFGAPATVPWLITSFPAAGTKDVRLRVTDNGGATGITTARFRINTPPTAAFDFAPAAPQTGDTVTFSSSASDADGVADLAATSWDLNGDGTYGDATGPTAKAVFLSAGSYTVGERVTDKGGAATTLTKTLSVAGPPAPAPQEPGDPGAPTTVVSSPGAPLVTGVSDNAPGRSPTASAAGTAGASAGGTVALRALRGVRVQLAGSVTERLTRITRLIVVAPEGALVVARCSGPGCPAHGMRLHVKASGRVRLAALERRLRAGAQITVSIAKPGFATRRIVLTMRKGKAPARSDGCIVPAGGGKTKVGRCPAA